MSGKRKDKPKHHEIKLFNKNIDLRRFAYDIIKYTALRFRVPENCIAVWDGKCNDYERDDFLVFMGIRILKFQIMYRRQCHVYFSFYYEKNRLAESQFVKDLLYEVIKELTDEFTVSPLKIVERSLTVACELFLFLYSKQMGLLPSTLAKTWHECYLNTNKKKFEDAKGLKEIYCRSNRRKLEIMDAFLDNFIEDHCLPYETSANNPNLMELFNESYVDSLSQKDKEALLKDFATLNEKAGRIPGVKYLDPVVPTGPTRFNLPEGSGNPLEESSQILKLLTASSQDLPVTSPEGQPAGATGFNLPEGTGIPLDQVSQLSSSFAAAALQDLPVTSHEGQPLHLRTLSLEERKKKLRLASPFDQGIRLLTLGSSATTQSSDPTPSVSIATGAAKSYENQGVRPKDRVQNTGSSDL